MTDFPKVNRERRKRLGNREGEEKGERSDEKEERDEKVARTYDRKEKRME